MNALLEQAANRTLTLIHAPAGFGKSTLAAQWASALSQRGTRTAWLSLDDDDSQTLWFLQHLIECIQGIHPGLAEHALQMLEERTDDTEGYIVPAIVNARQEASERSVIVLDDWHRVDSPRTHRVLAALLDSAGDKLGFIVTSRNTAGLPPASLHVHDQLVEVESREFLVDMKGLKLSGSELAALHSKTEGWVAALQLTSLSLRKNTDVAELLAELATRRHSIGGYLAENVVDLLEPRLRRFLVRISVLEQVNAELATLLTGESNAEELLDQALVGDLFLQRLDSTGVWFRFHHLFGDYPKYRLERDEPDIVRELHSLAARWFHDHDMLRQSVDHSLLAGEPKFAADVVEEQALTLVEHARMATLLDQPLLEAGPPIQRVMARLSVPRSAGIRATER